MAAMAASAASRLGAGVGCADGLLVATSDTGAACLAGVVAADRALVITGCGGSTICAAGAWLDGLAAG